MTSQEQRRIALDNANERRNRIAEIRRQLSSGRSVLADVLHDPPGELEHLMIVDVVRLAYGKRSCPSLKRLGRLAVRDGINLLVPLGEASERTREWAAQHATWHRTAT